MKTRKNLSGEALIKSIHSQFSKVPDSRKKSSISIEDALMAGFAIFKLKIPSLLKFDKLRKDNIEVQNLKDIFKVENVPSDTQIREILDPVPYYELFPVFRSLFKALQSHKIIETFKYQIPGAGDFLIHPIDGTGHFSSTSIRCDYCLARKIKHKDESEAIVYHHQMLGVGIVHPDKSIVLPFAPEPIITQDGVNKNDCEQNASKRYYYRLKEEHPKSSFLIIADALHATIPNLQMIKSFGWSFITSVKTGSHKYLFKQLVLNEDRVQTVVVKDIIGDKVQKSRTRTYRFINSISFRDYRDDEVNFLDFEEVLEWNSNKGAQRKVIRFSWVSDILVTKENVYQIMKAGRSRWKEENEVFNTLKNQGYNLEHNYGHGKQNLSTNFAILMSLAFLVDQIEELTCPIFQKARELRGAKYELWDIVKSLFYLLNFDSWTDLIQFIAEKRKPIKEINSS